MAERLLIVLDVGKTLAKISAWTPAGTLVERFTRQNEGKIIDGRRVLDALGIEAWLSKTLSRIGTKHEIEAIIPVGHGAAAAVIRDGRLALMPSDYEAPIDVANQASYAADRGHFAETGSPRLPDGLNLGIQLEQIAATNPGLLTKGSTILTWAQYWAWLLTGVAATEVSSLGCHTDLWSPSARSPSALAQSRGWAELLAPTRRADEVLGTMSAAWGVRTGLGTKVKVYCGLHDSNAALLAAQGFNEIAAHESTVLSTGTWFVAMRFSGADAQVDIETLAPDRDVLVNVSVEGHAIPSARFMGGREIQLLTGVDARRIDIRPDQLALLDALPEVMKSAAMVLPTMAPGFGPFPHGRGRWLAQPINHLAQRTAVSLYAALVADVSLDLVGSQERLLVEGRFADAEVFVRALATLRPDTTVYVSHAHGDVSYGALRLLDRTLPPPNALKAVEPLDFDITGYRDHWREMISREAAV